METTLSEKKRNSLYLLFILSSFLLYIVLTGAKNLYVAEKTTFSTVGFGNLTELALTMEYYFYAYAAMQVLLIFFMKKINVRWFLLITISLSAILTVIVAFTETIGQHYAIFIANGFLQAGIWGCLLKLLSDYLPMRYLPFANKLMSAGPAAAGIISYGTAAAFGDEWRTPFLVLGIVLLVFVGIYFVSAGRVSRISKTDELAEFKKGQSEEAKSEAENDFIHLDSKKRVAVFYIVSAVMCFFLTSLFFMLNNNIDVFFKEIGGFDNDISKLLTILVPITIVLGPMLTVSSCEKHKNFILVGAAYFGASAIVSLFILLFFNFNIVVSILLLVLFLTTVNGARIIILSVIGLRMRKKINTGVYSTAVNATASIASGFSPRFIAMILDNDSLSVVESWRRSFSCVFVLNVASVLAILGIALWVYLINRKGKSVA